MSLESERIDIIGFLKKYYIYDSPELITELALPSKGINCMPKYLGMLRKLNYLDLSHNELESLPMEIGVIKNLKNLYLADNNLTSLPKSINFLSKLTELSLTRNKLTTLPESIGNLTNLTDLGLGQNQLTTLPESIGNLKELAILNLEYNQLTNLPETIENLTNLTKLCSWDNQLTSLPKTIGNLTQLKELYLSKNKLKNLPESIGNLKELIYLDLKQNNLTSLPESIKNLTKLTKLSLWSNYLTSLPESIEKLTKLTELYLSDNQLTNLPETIGNLTKLTELYLRDNNLTTLPESIGKLTRLTNLSLRGNHFIFINDDLANKLQKNNNLKIKIDLIDNDENNDSCYYFNPTKKIMTEGFGRKIRDCNLSESEYVAIAMKRIKTIMEKDSKKNINGLKNYLFKSLAFNLRPKIFDEISKRYSLYEQGLEKIKDEDFEKYESSKKNNEKKKNDEIKKEIEIFKGLSLEMIIDNEGFNEEDSSLLKEYFAQETIDCYSELLYLKAKKIKNALEKNESLKKEMEEKINATYNQIMIDESKLYESIMNNDLPEALIKYGMRKIDKELFQQCLIKKYSNRESEMNDPSKLKSIIETMPPEILQENKIIIAHSDFLI